MMLLYGRQIWRGIIYTFAIGTNKSWCPLVKREWEQTEFILEKSIVCRIEWKWEWRNTFAADRLHYRNEKNNQRNRLMTYYRFRRISLTTTTTTNGRMDGQQAIALTIVFIFHPFTHSMNSNISHTAKIRREKNMEKTMKTSAHHTDWHSHEGVQCTEGRRIQLN